MDDQRSFDPKPLQRMRLGGIKFSERQTRVSLSLNSGDVDFSPILEALARSRINITQLFLEAPVAGWSDFCLDEHDYIASKYLLDQTFEQFDLPPVASTSVGRLTLFPHGSDPKVVFGALKSIAASNLPLYGAYSSLSAMSITTEYQSMDRMAESLLKVFELPAGHSPFRYQPSELDVRLAGGQGRKVETIAKYWEPIIKIYGSNLKTGLQALSITFAVDQLLPVVSILSGAKGLENFKMMGLSSPETGVYHLLLLFMPSGGELLDANMNKKMSELTEVKVSEQSALEVLYFHGPHFQDRYGVASAVVGALKKASVEFLCLNCSGTSIYLVMQKNIGSQAQKALEKVLVVP